MNLSKKKLLASKALKIGKNRIFFSPLRLEEVKEAITKQDIKDLYKNGAIIIKDIKGRKKIIRKKRKKGPGKVRKIVNKRKKEYVIMTRKLRGYLSEIKRQGKLSKEEIDEIKKKIRNRFFRSKASLKEYLGGVEKEK